MEGKRPYALIAILQLLNHFFTSLELHPAFLIIWLPLSVWISLWQLRPCVNQTLPSSLPVHSAETIIKHRKGHTTVLVMFFNAWLTMIHFFVVIASNLASNWFILVFTTLLLIVSFAQYLDSSAVPRDRWGHFYILYRIAAFAFYSIYAILWVIDLFQGRIELVRRREE